MKSTGFRFRFRVMIAALAITLGSAISNAQTADAAPHHGQEFGFADRMIGFYADYLNLTDAQQTQMKSIIEKEHATMKPLMQQLRQTHTQLKQYEEGAFDEAKVRALAAQDAQAETELTVQRTRIHSELFAVLTPDQQAKMKDFEARREARMQKHMHTDGAPPAPEAQPEQ
jgi:periplasmic protein CpxP/Spy